MDYRKFSCVNSDIIQKVIILKFRYLDIDKCVNDL